MPSQPRVTPKNLAALETFYPSVVKALIESPDVPTGMQPGIFGPEATIRGPIDVFTVAQVIFDKVVWTPDQAHWPNKWEIS